ncbi:hypothetical protein ORL62_29175 [Bacillus cereus]|uniref:hypothetical protein n=1 Tax=Bacillus cereus TaxID=1396 RepID=UPI002ABFAA4D|nr:hypothetical protein [Bacillus cereus]MDZ4411870.1 hypothetical protein [Bacillus cereus]
MKEYKELVLDACIARSAGDFAEAPNSKYCREFIDEFVKSKHKLIMTEELLAEWNKHESRFSRKIRVMLITKQRVLFKKCKNEVLRQSVNNIPDKSRIGAIMKDIHLVEAANKGDNIIVSLDEKIHRHFLYLKDYSPAGFVDQLNWINPTKNPNNVIDWFRNGAELIPEIQLESSIS